MSKLICLGNPNSNSGLRVYNTRSYRCLQCQEKAKRLSDYPKKSRLNIVLRSLKQDSDFEFYMGPAGRQEDWDDVYEVFRSLKKLTALGLAEMLEEPRTEYDSNGNLRSNSPHGYFRFSITEKGEKTASVSWYKWKEKMRPFFQFSTICATFIAALLNHLETASILAITTIALTILWLK